MEKLPNSKEQFFTRELDMLLNFVKRPLVRTLGVGTTAAMLLTGCAKSDLEDFNQKLGILRAQAIAEVDEFGERSHQVAEEARANARYSEIYQRDRINYQRTFRLNAGASNKGSFYNIENTERNNIKRDNDND